MRQFDLRQDKSAMKIGTDGVLAGAWCGLPRVGTVWDIGTGTGLMALMAAQRCRCEIVGFEIDPEAAEEAQANAKDSPWSQRVKIMQGDVMESTINMGGADAIISNPPFFATSLKPSNLRRSNARHEQTLTLDALIELASRKLAPKGVLSFIAPADRTGDIEASACFRRLNIQRMCMVHSREGKPPMRVLVQMGFELTPIEHTTLNIRNARGEYTKEYKELTKEFYTHWK